MKPGKVYLIGAGPGDPGLITVKGLTCIHTADVVIYDPQRKHVLSAETHHMNVDYNSYAGMEVTGKVEQVFLRGTAVDLIFL